MTTSIKKIPELKIGQKVICNGYEGSIRKICTGALQGMVEVMLPGGLACVDASEVRS